MGSGLSNKELGVFQVVIERYNKQRLPLLLKMKEKVDKGGLLEERELAVLEESIAEAKSGEAFADKHPEFKNLVSGALKLYDHITEKALENKKANT